MKKVREVKERSKRNERYTGLKVKMALETFWKAGQSENLQKFWQRGEGSERE